MSITSFRSSMSEVGWLLAAVAVIFLYSMGNHPFIPSMEPRFGEAIREMVATGNFLIPIKNGVAYIEYPVLYYWLALAGKFVGLSDEYAIRLPSFIAFLVWIVWLVRLQRVLFPQWRALLLPLLAATVPITLYNFFIAQTDGMLSLGALIAFTGFARYRLRQSAPGFQWELWLGVTLATAAKGPVGIAITLPAMMLEIMLARGVLEQVGWKETWRELWGMAWWRGIGLVLLFNAPWYITAGLQQGWEFCRAILVYQNFSRFFEGYSHPQPWWYFGRTVWYDFFPLALLLPFGLYAAWQRRAQFEARLPAIWLLYTVLFFTLSQSKQGKYLMPAAPTLAVLGLVVLHELGSPVWQQRLRKIFVAWAALMLLAAAIITNFVLPRYADRIGGVGDFAQIRAVIKQRPGALCTYPWPRAMMLYELGAPLPHFRSARDLYAAVQSGKLRAGDYVLAEMRYVPSAGEAPVGDSLTPEPQPPYFETVLELHQDQHMKLYRVLPDAAAAPLPQTPEPYPVQWFERFDTD